MEPKGAGVVVRMPRDRKAAGAETVARSPRAPRGIPRDADKGLPLLQVRSEHRAFDELIVGDAVRERLMAVIDENKASEDLLHYGLRPTNRILLCGPPGTGKTLTAKVVASAMGYKLVHVVFDSMVAPYLGETASNMRKIFEFVGSGRYVVLFDEFDIVGKSRGDQNEHGEIRRLVNNFMQMMDDFEGPGIILAATNHQRLLDRAVWRRFDDVIVYDMPDLGRRRALLEKYLGVLRWEDGLDLGGLAEKTAGFSAADVARTCEEALRRAVVGGGDAVGEDGVRRAISEQRRRIAAAGLDAG